MNNYYYDIENQETLFNRIRSYSDTITLTFFGEDWIYEDNGDTISIMSNNTSKLLFLCICILFIYYYVSEFIISLD